MTPERIAEIRARVEAALGSEAGPWTPKWDGQQFYVQGAAGGEIMEYTFAIPTWEPRYEAAKATCDIAVPMLLAHAPQDITDLLDEIERLQQPAADRPAGERGVTFRLGDTVIHDALEWIVSGRSCGARGTRYILVSESSNETVAVDAITLRDEQPGLHATGSADGGRD